MEKGVLVNSIPNPMRSCMCCPVCASVVVCVGAGVQTMEGNCTGKENEKQNGEGKKEGRKREANSTDPVVFAIDVYPLLYQLQDGGNLAFLPGADQILFLPHGNPTTSTKHEKCTNFLNRH